MSMRDADDWPLTNTLWSMLIGGLVLQVAGCVTAVVQAPRTELSSVGVIEEGNRWLAAVGLLGVGLGGVLSLTAVIAFGVLLGLRAHARS